MKETNLALLNTSILTSYGVFIYQPISLAEAGMLVREFQREGKTIQSVIGHNSTADLLTLLLKFPVEINRQEFKQTIADLGLVFKLKGRAPEGKVLSREEIEAIGYEFGLLAKTA
jgi:hypothetical protein